MTNEELEQEVKRLEEQITKLRFKILESKAEKKPYEVEVPEDINHLAYLDEEGYCIPLEDYDYINKKNIFIRGLVFETREEAEQYDRERILLFKLHKWAEEHNGEWEHDLGSSSCRFFIVLRFSVLDEKGFVLSVEENGYYDPFSKLPYFKTEEIAEQFIKEFGDEIKEVLC